MASSYSTVAAEKRSASNRESSSQHDRSADDQLAAAAKRGEAAAFDELCRSNAAKVLRTTYRITKNREDAEDALQDSLLKAFVHIHDFDGRSSFATWLTRIAINSALMILRKRHARLELSIDDRGNRGENVAFLDFPDDAPSPELSCAQRERDEILQSAISELRPAIRQAVELKKLHEHSLEETAQMLGVSVPATKSRLHQAKAELRRLLAPKNLGHGHVPVGGFRFAPAR